MAYSHQGEFELAIVESTLAVDLDPTLALAFINRGHAYIQQYELDLAIADLTQAIELDPTLKSAFHNRGLAYLQLSELDLAIDDFTKSIELQPDFALAYPDRALALFERGDFTAALADAEQAIELDSGLAPGYYGRGLVHAQFGRDDRALDDYSRAIELYPDYFDAVSARSRLHLRQKNAEAALADIGLLIELAPDLAFLYARRGAARAMGGDRAGALDDFDRAMSMATDSDEIRDIHEMRAEAGFLDRNGSLDMGSGLTGLEALSGAWHDELWLSSVPQDRMDTTGDLQHAFWFEELDGGSVKFVWDGRAGQVFDMVLNQADDEILVWDAAEQRVAYYGTRGDRWFVGLDGTEDPGFEGVTRSVPPVFSPDGAHLAYGAYVDGSPRLVVDGKVTSDRHLAPVAAVWGPSGDRLAYVAETREIKKDEEPTDRKQWVVLDGSDLPSVDNISPTPGAMQFSPDGRRFAYAEVTNGRIRFVVDGSADPFVLDAVDPTFSPDSRRFIYAAKLEKGMAMIDEGRSGPTFDQVGLPVFSADSSRSLYAARRGKRWSVIVDGVAGPEFADFWAMPSFSPDGRHVAYLAEVHGSGVFGAMRRHWVAVLDGAIQGEWDEVASEVHFSPDSAHFAFSARRGKTWMVVVDGEAGSGFEHVGLPRWGASGRLAHVV
jgi:tetratricopeptide (TPR) repeat protein